MSTLDNALLDPFPAVRAEACGGPLRRYPGVISTRVGYTGGDVQARPIATMEVMPKR